MVAAFSWEEFLYQYIETGWFDFEDRPKTMKAMRRVWESVPAEVWDEMPSLIVFAPCPWKFGEVLPFGGHPAEEAAFIYLSPALESQRQARVDFTVAHEFAHVVLGHHRPDSKDVLLTTAQSAKITEHHEAPAEIKADALTESWGFTVPDERQHVRS